MPHTDLTDDLRRVLFGNNIQVVADTGRKIKDLVSRKTEGTKEKKSIVNEMPCSGCDNRYYNESSSGLDTRLKEHKADLKYHQENSALVNHMDKNKSPVIVECG